MATSEGVVRHLRENTAAPFLMHGDFADTIESSTGST